jgi:hypothetical protein
LCYPPYRSEPRLGSEQRPIESLILGKSYSLLIAII